MFCRGLKAAARTARLSRGLTYQDLLRQPLKEADPEIYSLIKEETERQRSSINLIASENYASVAALEAMGSPLNNKYSEGYPGARYYGGCEVIDKLETLAIKRALEAFNLDPAKWGVNFQALSGAPANLTIFYAIGGVGCKHLSHGYYLRDKHVSATSAYFNCSHYRRDPVTDLWNYDEINLIAERVKPKVLVAGYSSYSHHYDYKRMKEIIAAQDGYLLADISHISGLVSAGLAPNPFDHSDVVMTTTHKTLGTVRNAIIFFRKGHFGGPHNHAIGGAAVGLKLVTHPLYKAYQSDVAANAKVLCDTMQAKGYPIVGNGTSNHLAIINVKEKGIDGARVDHFCSRMSISVNKNVIPGGQNAVIPGGLRLGSPAMTTRGCKAEDFKAIAGILDRAIALAKGYKREKQTLAQYKALVDESLAGDDKAQALRREVGDFSRVFPFPYN